MDINEFKIIVNVEKLYSNGMSRKEIAEKYNLTINKINEYLNIASSFRA